MTLVSAIPHYSLMAQKLYRGYRVVVKARDAARARDFIWEIVQGNDPDVKAVTRSIRAFKTMEEAYTSGAAALERISKRRVTPV